MNKLPPCHVCSEVLIGIECPGDLFQVTSDCRPWRERASWAVCGKCGTVQKPVTDDWLEQANRIYAGYAIYAQGGGMEQSAFNAESGAQESRSRRIVGWLDKTCQPSSRGSLLDIGCGNGAFLRAFHDARPEWALTGAELDDRNRVAVERIPGARFHSGPISEERETYDYIVLIHALEHIANPVDFLSQRVTLLAEGGTLLVQVPHLTNSPFDLLIADHCTHFTAATLAKTVEAAGYEIIDLSIDMVPKELSLLARPRKGVARGKILHDAEEGLHVVSEHVSWLRALKEQGVGLRREIGIFGSSISASWLASEIGDPVLFFVDEDENRIGSTHMGRPIVAVGNTPADCPVLVPLRFDIARSVINRLGEGGRRFVLPPQTKAAV